MNKDYIIENDSLRTKLKESEELIFKLRMEKSENKALVKLALNEENRVLREKLLNVE